MSWRASLTDVAPAIRVGSDTLRPERRGNTWSATLPARGDDGPVGTVGVAVAVFQRRGDGIVVAGEVEVWQSGRRLMLFEVPGAPAAVRAPIDAAFAAVRTPIESAAAGRVVTVDVETTDRVVGLTVSVTDDGLLVVAAPPGVWLPDQRGGWLLSALYVAQDRLGLRIEQLRGIVLQ